ncbi:MAG: hypothetical protein HIU84_14255 [Acidobacteria bacterium]|nr:hypothetical protein [Acidobacteriota bacterium]
MKRDDWAGALCGRDFLLFFVAQTTSQIGSGMAPMAIAFAALRHGTASDLGFVSAAGLTPLVVLLLVGGVIADRVSRRAVMLGSDSLRTTAEIGLGSWIHLSRPLSGASWHLPPSSESAQHSSIRPSRDLSLKSCLGAGYCRRTCSTVCRDRLLGLSDRRSRGSSLPRRAPEGLYCPMD